ncbi:hypothetical protein AGMMS49991_00280 [Spirochaetia bacterium]|nr:hypothetical protein AGMMS49991_00280 [Spirochaetia bacterium]
MKGSDRSGLVLLDKKPGLTSFQALNQVKKAFSTPKVGHTGTLDKFASGLLLVLVGRAVKLAPWFNGCDKRYEGTIRFGAETDTLDPEGAVIAEEAPPGREALEAVLEQFRGDILQAPPAYSAVHIDGARAHELARSGVDVEMKKRPVSVYALELVSYQPPEAQIRVHCSKGTYIRSLARDIALAAGSRAHLTALKRTQIAGFHLADAVDLAAANGNGGATGAVAGNVDGAIAGSAAGNTNTGSGDEEINDIPTADTNGANGAAASPCVLKPITAAVFHALNIACMEADAETAVKLIQGKPIEPLIAGGRLPFFSPENASLNDGALADVSTAVFDKNGGFIAVLEKKGGRWGYGYVYACVSGTSPSGRTDDHR